ncbi:hypothetical protein HDU76_005351, partial [Blyttiomyces sp. JEL0837]
GVEPVGKHRNGDLGLIYDRKGLNDGGDLLEFRILSLNNSLKWFIEAKAEDLIILINPDAEPEETSLEQEAKTFANRDNVPKSKANEGPLSGTTSLYQLDPNTKSNSHSMNQNNGNLDQITAMAKTFFNRLSTNAERVEAYDRLTSSSTTRFQTGTRALLKGLQKIEEKTRAICQCAGAINDRYKLKRSKIVMELAEIRKSIHSDVDSEALQKRLTDLSDKVKDVNIGGDSIAKDIFSLQAELAQAFIEFTETYQKVRDDRFNVKILKTSFWELEAGSEEMNEVGKISEDKGRLCSRLRKQLEDETGIIFNLSTSYECYCMELYAKAAALLDQDYRRRAANIFLTVFYKSDPKTVPFRYASLAQYADLLCNAAMAGYTTLIYIDGADYVPDFLSHLIVFALRLRNSGISDKGLIVHLSEYLAGNSFRLCDKKVLSEEDLNETVYQPNDIVERTDKGNKTSKTCSVRKCLDDFKTRVCMFVETLFNAIQEVQEELDVIDPTIGIFSQTAKSTIASKELPSLLKIGCNKCGAKRFNIERDEGKQIYTGLRQCLRCQRAVYCSRKCQKEDRKIGGHKHVCREADVLRVGDVVYVDYVDVSEPNDASSDISDISGGESGFIFQMRPKDDGDVEIRILARNSSPESGFIRCEPENLTLLVPIEHILI